MKWLSVLFAATCLGLAGGPSGSRFVSLIGNEFEIIIGVLKVRHGKESDRNMIECRDFRLSVGQVDHFFRSARVITPEIRHHEYSWYPCWLTGTLRTPEKVFLWEISPGGTATVMEKEKESDARILACDSECEALFPFGGRDDG